MEPLTLALWIVVATLAVLATGIPIAFGLALVSTVFFLAIEGFGRVPLLAEQFWNGLQDFGIVTIPMFLLMGIAVAASPAGKDLYSALDRWLNKVPGGLVISNLGACSIFAALCGSSPATCAAIGKMGIPEMRKRGYSPELAAGTICAGGTLGILIPPSITMIIYGISTGTSIGKLFIAGIIPGIMLTALFMIWAFIYAVVYKMYDFKNIWAILEESMKESVMLMLIIAASFLFSFILSNLYITQTLAKEMVEIAANKWLLMLYINLFLLVAGCFLPPVAIILMTAPILYPIITAAGFDPIWFGVIMTINMEIGLITPPVGLNLFVIQGIAPDISIGKILKGSFPFVLLMILQIVLLCIFPEIATWLPSTVMK
ncbi:MAG: TRAP transporter large permease [Candidatus Fonsibacter ubiquis]|nr:TRAP transporter large permease [Candidatus Fonsibacter ubiquis]